MKRREFLARSLALGASAAWAGARPVRSGQGWTERRELYPEGVASGDPDENSVLLWTRRPFSQDVQARLRVEVAEDEPFSRVMASTTAKVLAAADWTCRVLVGNLQPSRIYWYRFIDAQGNASRIGRTVTAPAAGERRSVRFAVVSCQDISTTWLHAYRRMIFEDRAAPAAERIELVLHLGDFIYESLWYPSDNPQAFFGLPLREIVRYPRGEKIELGTRGTIHIPATLNDYRAIYRAYLHDPDLQDARARWPFVCMWDNHEFSWAGWQSLLLFGGRNKPAQTRKVAASQAWFEYQPARILKSGGARLEHFNPPRVRDAPIERFDDHGLGDEPNNRAAIASLTGYRALRWGPHVELIVTDQRSYRSETPSSRPQAAAFSSADFPFLMPEEALQILDAGRAYAQGSAPETIRFGDRDIANFRRTEPPQTLLGAEQKRWFLDRLTRSTATWKIWGNTMGTLDQRTDPQNLPAGLTRPWPGAGYSVTAAGDPSTAYLERTEIYSAMRDARITGFVTVSGDRHSFWAGLAAPALPPQPFEPVGVAFVVGSISSIAFAEFCGDEIKLDHPLRGLYVGADPHGGAPESVVSNLLFHHGVRSAYEYQRTGDVEGARRLSNPELAPHLSFLDLAGHGYMTVRAAQDALECEFVCIPRPSQPNQQPDGGPLRYRVIHRVPLWKAGETPRLELRVAEGDPALCV